MDSFRGLSDLGLLIRIIDLAFRNIDDLSCLFIILDCPFLQRRSIGIRGEAFFGQHFSGEAQNGESSKENRHRQT